MQFMHLYLHCEKRLELIPQSGTIKLVKNTRPQDDEIKTAVVLNLKQCRKHNGNIHLWFYVFIWMWKSTYHVTHLFLPTSLCLLSGVEESVDD